MKMKKTVFMKVLALLFVGTGALAYSCSGDDIFEEEEDARSLAKRAMQTRGAVLIRDQFVKYWQVKPRVIVKLDGLVLS